MAGILVTTKLSTLNSSKELQQQSSTEFQTQWSWRIKFQNNIFHLIFTITLCQMMMRLHHITNRFQELVLSKSVTRVCLSSQSSREDTGQTASWSLKNVCLSTKMRAKVKIAPNILQETAQWKLEDTECHQQRNKEEWVKLQLKTVNQDHNLTNQLLLLPNSDKKMKVLELMNKTNHHLKCKKITIKLNNKNKFNKLIEMVKMFKLDLTFKAQMLWLDSQCSHQVPNHLFQSS